MEEIVQALFEERALARNGTVKLTKSMNEVKVPATVQAALSSRIDRLQSVEKDLLQTVAVIGKEFSLRLAAEIARVPELERMLADLQTAEFIYEQPAAGNVECTFNHALTQQVAYDCFLVVPNAGHRHKWPLFMIGSTISAATPPFRLLSGMLFFS